MTIASAVCLLLTGCQSTESREAPTISAAVQSPPPPRPAASSTGGNNHAGTQADTSTAARHDSATGTSAQATPSDRVVARVNGVPVWRSQFVELLIAGHGGDMLQQLVAVELAEQEARKMGITVSDEQVQLEYRRSVAAMLPDTDRQGQPLDEAEKRTLLRNILQRRGVSIDEFQLAVRRNAILRALAADKVQVSEDMLRQEYDQRTAAKVVVRHIQLPNLRMCTQVRERLEQGESFESLARQFSTNPETAPVGGLMQPFTRDNPDLPGIFKERAFALHVGEISNPIKTDTVYHLIRLEQRIAPTTSQFEQMRPELYKAVRERMIAEQARQIQQQLFARADLEINNPALAKDFEQAQSRLVEMGALNTPPAASR